MATPDAPDPRKVAEAALDVFVYAPMGLALEAKELLPKLAERGRNQVVLARLGARFAKQRAEAEVDKFLERLQPHPTAPPKAPAAPTEKAEPVKDERQPAPAPERAKVARPRPTAAPRARKSTSRVEPVVPEAKRKASTALAIPGYDTLSASQVVPRLDALRPPELEAVRRHEVAGRGRRTILNRIAQLQS